MGFLGGACGNAAIVASVDTKCSRVTHCKVLRPRGVLEATGGAGDGDD